MVVLVTGAKGQLGEALQYVSNQVLNQNFKDKEAKTIQFFFYSSSELDITNIHNIETIFSKIKPNFCINAAAYTAVDKAESEHDKAQAVNVFGAKNIAEVCNSNYTTLIHISTDFVFDGSKNTPYNEEDVTNPKGIYGKTKRDGELQIIKNLNQYFIIRTSWLFSSFGNNFMKTMLRLANERKTLNIINDQIGTPTHAIDLAHAIISIILSNNKLYGIYNFSNEGSCSWYDFAKKIFQTNNIKIELKPIPTSEFPTPAKRPKYSVLDKTKIKKTFNIVIRSWQDTIEKQ